MNTILLLGSIFLNSISPAGPKDVYICNNEKAVKYHYSSTCRGLSNCQYKVLKIGILIAKKKGMTLCTWEGQENKQPVKSNTGRSGSRGHKYKVDREQDL